MPDAPSFDPLLIYCCLGLLSLLVLLAFWILSRLGRIEKRLSQSQKPINPPDSAPSVVETASGGAFESFLAEDPARRGLTKAEQFAAYRQWRQTQGLNWSNSPDNL
jgi:hypothetical protein